MWPFDSVLRAKLQTLEAEILNLRLALRDAQVVVAQLSDANEQLRKAQDPDAAPRPCLCGEVRWQRWHEGKVRWP